MPAVQRHPTLFQSYAERAEQPNLTPLAIYLFQLMHLKRTNLCVSADVTTTTQLLELAEEVGDDICVLKTHADIIKDFGDKTVRGLLDVARRKKFALFEDRKFGDIGNTVQMQYTSGPLAIVKWAHMINAHLFPGPAIITSLSEGAKNAVLKHNSSVETDISAALEPDGTVDDKYPNGHYSTTHNDDDYSELPDRTDYDRMGRKHSVVSVSTTISTKTEAVSPQPALRHTLSHSSDSNNDSIDEAERKAQLEEIGEPPFYRSLILLAQMSSKDNFLTPEYTQACAKHARQHRDFVMGFIAQESLNAHEDDNFITMTPGVQLGSTGDGQGQQYNTPAKVVAAGTDVIIVGRGILQAEDRRRAAEEYRRQGWAAYEDRIRGARKR